MLFCQNLVFQPKDACNRSPTPTHPEKGGKNANMVMNPEALLDYERTMACFNLLSDQDLVAGANDTLKKAKLTQVSAVLFTHFEQNWKPELLRQHVQAEMMSLRVEGIKERESLAPPLYERVLTALAGRG